MFALGGYTYNKGLKKDQKNIAIRQTKVRRVLMMIWKVKMRVLIPVLR